MEQNLSMINDLLPVLTSGKTGVWEYNASSGQLVFKNDFFEILNFTSAGIKFSSLDELRAVIHTDDLPDFEQAFADASTGKTTSVSYRCCYEDQQMQLESKLIPIDKGVVACTRNKDTDLKLKNLKKQYKTVVNSLFPNFCWVWDKDFYIKDIVLPDGLKLFHKREDLVDTDMSVQFASEVNELLITNIHESLKNNQWKEVEYYIDLFGTRYFYQSRIVPLDEDKVVSLNMEIGDRVRRMNELLAQRQRAEESDKLKNIFIANMSHEIRTPLNAIIGFSGFLMNEKNSGKRQKYMDIVRNSSLLLRQIVSDILDLSRLEAGMTEFNFEDTDIIAMMKEVAEVYTPAMKPGVRLLLEIPDKDLQAPTDDFRMKQILSNLISNAIKYTEKGAITLKVETGTEYLTLSVADTGCGIPEEKLEVIFDRFEKLNRFVQGTGLGLAICKFIIERLGGKIMVKSKVGEGSVFSFSIPYRNYFASHMRNIGGKYDDVPLRRKKILMAETSEENLHFVCENLSKKYDIVNVTEPEKIINSIILDNPNIILICMEFAGKQDIIRKIRSISANIPIIAMTSSDYYHDQRQAFENGCTDVLAKPFSASKLEEMVMAFIV